jgi:hypothetical protein
MAKPFMLCNRSVAERHDWAPGRKDENRQHAARLRALAGSGFIWTIPVDPAGRLRTVRRKSRFGVSRSFLIIQVPDAGGRHWETWKPIGGTSSTRYTCSNPSLD